MVGYVFDLVVVVLLWYNFCIFFGVLMELLVGFFVVINDMLVVVRYLVSKNNGGWRVGIWCDLSVVCDEYDKVYSYGYNDYSFGVDFVDFDERLGSWLKFVRVVRFFCCFVICFFWCFIRFRGFG